MLRLEQLEERYVPATATLVSGILFVSGTAGNDEISVDSLGGGAAQVSDENGVVGTFAGVDRIFVLAGDGDDTVTIDAAFTIRADLYGGDGNDVLTGGSGDDYVSGGAGDDVIFAGDGDDTVRCGTGNDQADGGAGFDTVFDDTLGAHLVNFEREYQGV